MREGRRARVRMALVALLLMGVAAVRAVDGFPHDPLPSLHRIVAHPGKYLEDATYSLQDDISMKQKIYAKSWWRTAGVQSSMGDFPSVDAAELPSRFSNSGGFLQLCLLLVFCLAIICCASTSINPWHKAGDLHVMRKVAAGIGGSFTLLTNMLIAKLTLALDGKQEGIVRGDVSQRGQEGRPAPLPLLHSSKKLARSKKRRVSHSVLQHTGPAVPPARLIEKTVSNASDDMSSISMDVELGQGSSEASSEHESALASFLTPADAQIARLEAEAQERELHRLAKQKRHHKSVVQAPKPSEEVGQQTGDAMPAASASKAIANSVSRDVTVASKPDSLAKSVEGRERALEHRETVKSKQERKYVDVEVRTHSRRAKENRGQEQSRGDGDMMERHRRKPVHSDRNVTQVLVVPRKSLFSKHKSEVQTVVDDQAERTLAPHTPDRATSRSNGPSSMSSPQSMSSPSRPYAEVARESLPKPVWGNVFFPPPPPPPPRKLSALPKSAVYAQEFTPAAQRMTVPAHEVQQPDFLAPHPAQSHPHVLGRASAPPTCCDLEISAQSDPGDGLESAPSPFPGMSMHRKRAGLPVTSMHNNVLPNSQQFGMRDFELAMSTFTSRTPSSTESDPYTIAALAPNLGSQNAWLSEPGFPGIVDHIWNRSVDNRLEQSHLWAGHSELVSDVSLASSSDLGCGVFSQYDRPLLALGHTSM